MGRKKGIPTEVLSARIPQSDYEKIKEYSRRTGKSISQIWRELIKSGRYKG